MTLWTAGHQAPLSMGFPNKNVGRRVTISFLRDLPDAGIGTASLVSPEPQLSRFLTLGHLWQHNVASANSQNLLNLSLLST